MEIQFVKIDQIAAFTLHNNERYEGKIKYIPQAGEAWVIEDAYDPNILYFIQEYIMMTIYKEQTV